MIHFFLTFSKNAADSPFGQRLAEMGVCCRIIAGEVRHRHRHRAWMLLVGRPQTLWFGVRAAWRSLVQEQSRPRAVVVWTHIEALTVALLRALVLRRHRTRIVLVGFIMTERSGRLHRWLRERYFRTVFRVVQLVVVHSSVEQVRYTSRFRGLGARFVFIPWGSHIEGLQHLQPDDAGTGADVFSAGRSGRDYATLCRAFGDSALQVRIACDRPQALDGCRTAPNLLVLTACHGSAYLAELHRARCVVIPLAVGDISAGQMVLLQAMEMGKPVVITRTATTVDYATDEHDVLMVPPGDAAALSTAVLRLLADAPLRHQLVANARRSFAERFTVPAFVTQLVEHVRIMDPQAGRPTT